MRPASNSCCFISPSLASQPGWCCVHPAPHIPCDNKHLIAARTLSGASAAVPKNVFPLGWWGSEQMSVGENEGKSQRVGRDELTASKARCCLLLHELTGILYEKGRVAATQRCLGNTRIITSP